MAPGTWVGAEVYVVTFLIGGMFVWSVPFVNYRHIMACFVKEDM